MKQYKQSREEKEFLDKYKLSDYERPSLATDIVIFSIMNDGERKSKRHLQKRNLKVLLIKRAAYPFKDYWALPGGFCIPSEDVIETARRELKEETNVDNAYLKLIGAYGKKGRDPRGWIISNAFMALMNEEECKLRAGTDAWEARWFIVEFNDETNEINAENTSENGKLKIVLDAKEEKGLAFDHEKIILDALRNLRKEAEYNPHIIFDLMPEYFTLTQLQNAFEIVLGKELIPNNFRRKIMPYVIETDKIIEGEGFRPAKLFSRNINRF